MKQAGYFAKQEDQFASFHNLFLHLSELQRLQQENIVSGIRSRQQRRLKPVRDGALARIPSTRDWLNYSTDYIQRSILFFDTLRQRGDNTLEHEREGYPVLLKFDYELILDGTTLPAPVNYSLLRIKPGPDQHIDESLPPLIVIDPRGGHGAGIGGFKQDSAIGESLRAGHATYFIAFAHMPEPGQTLDDIASAQAHFLELVRARHPEAGKPVVIGNCQAGWAVMGLAALRPDLPGLVIINGAPLSYWAGVSGRNPMRYTGGLFGGAWMTRLGSDMGNGRFDGAWLVNNFENLDPANTYWKKHYALFTNIDTEPPRFLDFERWWGAPVLFNREEIESVVDDLFIGNRLSGANPRKGAWVDLRRIEAPVVVFCSSGDNITPPQQALNWIADIYPTDLALHSAGRTIVYLKHESIGHLGIFVSGQVARREHRELIGAVDAIHALPPGLYELIIDDAPSDGQSADAYKVHFEHRQIADILSHDKDGRDDEREFALVDRVSEINSTFYDWTIRPWMQRVISEPVASLLRQAHPFRQERTLLSSLNPALWWLPSAAKRVQETRKPVAQDNPLLAWQHFWSATIEDTLDAWRDIRDASQEMAFHAVYGWMSTLTGGASAKQTRRPSSHHDQALVERLREALPNGGKIDATLRILLLLANASGKLNKDTLKRLLADYRQASTSESDDELEALREVAYLQNMLVFAYPQESLDTLPLLLPKEDDRRKVMEAVTRIEPQWLQSEGPVGELWRELYELLELPVADFAQETAPATEALIQPEQRASLPSPQALDTDSGERALAEAATVVEADRDQPQALEPTPETTEQTSAGNPGQDVPPAAEAPSVAETDALPEIHNENGERPPAEVSLLVEAEQEEAPVPEPQSSSAILEAALQGDSEAAKATTPSMSEDELAKLTPDISESTKPTRAKRNAVRAASDAPAKPRGARKPRTTSKPKPE